MTQKLHLLFYIYIRMWDGVQKSCDDFDECERKDLCPDFD